MYKTQLLIISCIFLFLYSNISLATGVANETIYRYSSQRAFDEWNGIPIGEGGSAKLWDYIVGLEASFTGTVGGTDTWVWEYYKPDGVLSQTGSLSWDG